MMQADTPWEIAAHNWWELANDPAIDDLSYVHFDTINVAGLFTFGSPPVKPDAIDPNLEQHEMELSDPTPSCRLAILDRKRDILPLALERHLGSGYDGARPLLHGCL